MRTLSPEEWTFFRENGYIKIDRLIPEAECNAVIDALFDFLEMERDNPEDWYRLPLRPGGMIEMYQHPAMWNTRQNPDLHSVFADIWGRRDLWVTFDRVGFKPPQHPDHPDYDHKGFTHWDCDTSQKPLPTGYQGVLYLSDTDSNMGGFQCIPGFYRERLEEWIKTQPADRNPRIPNLTGLTNVPIPGKAGDFVIWDVTLAHGNGHNVSQQPRFSQYIAMYPAKNDPELREDRIRQWQEREPPGNSIFPGDPRRIEQTRGTMAELTPLGRKLLGLDDWEETAEQ
jgi:hypothetical protein